MNATKCFYCPDMLATLAFYAKHPGLHSFDKRCKVTLGAVRRLEQAGFLRVSWPTYQAEFAGKTFNMGSNE